MSKVRTKGKIMNSIVLTYPYFQSLPKGLKMMLVESEAFFYQQGHAAHTEANAAAYQSKATRMDLSGVLAFPGNGSEGNKKSLPGARAFPE